MQEINEKDKQKVLEWFERYVNGFRNARTRANILPCFPCFSERYLREIISKLKHEGHIGSSCTKGYWRIPLVTNDVAEIEAAMESNLEMKAKALDMLTDCERHLKHWQERKDALTKQMEFV